MIKFEKNFRNADPSEIIKNYPEEFKKHIYLCFKSLVSDELGVRNLVKTSKVTGLPYTCRDEYTIMLGNECSCYTIENSYHYISTKRFDVDLNKIYDYNRQMKEKILQDRIWELCEFYKCSEYIKYKNNDYSNNIASYYQIVNSPEFVNYKDMIDDVFVNYMENKNPDILPKFNLKFTIGDACNYKCPSCRHDYNQEDVVLDECNIESLIKFMDSYKALTLGCMGEFFYKDNYMQIFRNKVDVDGITLFSNGSLFNEKNFLRMHPDNGKKIKTIYISIDAGTKETYSKVRSTTFDLVCKNLEFLNELKKDIGFELITNYTISKLNMNDVIAFADKFHDKFDKIIYNFARPTFNGMEFKDAITDMNARSELTNTIHELHNQYPCILI